MRIDFAICRCVRTEYGKRIRKLYESHQISEKRGNMTQLEARTDGISNTLTTVQKDNLVLEMILSILVYTFFSRMFDLMLPPVAKHSIVVA